MSFARVSVATAAEALASKHCLVRQQYAVFEQPCEEATLQQVAATLHKSEDKIRGTYFEEMIKVSIRR